jgi:hypothetical protein
MKRRPGRPLPRKDVPRRKLPAKTRHTTVQPRALPVREMPPLRMPKARVSKPPRRPRHQVARIVDEEDSSLLDLIDNLLAKGVMLNADLILALADVDLVYVRLSALLCAADRVVPGLANSPQRAGTDGRRRTGT